METPSTPEKPSIHVGNSPVEASNSSKSKPTEAKPKTPRWRWNDEMIDSLILCLHDYKIKKDFEGKDMESDLVKMYEEIRQMMAILYPPDYFGPVKISSINRELRSEERIKHSNAIQEEQRNIKIGYGRIKERLKLVRRNFKKAVVEGTRSGSGKIILQNWEYLVKIWGGCPSVTRIEGAITTQVINNENNEDETENFNLFDEDGEAEIQDEMLENRDPNSQKEQPAEKSKGAKLMDNKRAKLEKNLSAQQRDLVMVKVAKEELELKKKTAEMLEQSARGMEKAAEAMAKSLESFGDQLGSGLILLAQSLAATQNTQQSYHQPIPFPQPHYRPQPYSQQNSSFIHMMNTPLRHNEEEQLNNEL